jgi:hypothetical protein
MFSYKDFSWTFAAVEKADRWRHKDGSWWTNVSGKVVPWHPVTHPGEHRKMQDVVSAAGFGPEHKKTMGDADRHTLMENATRGQAGKMLHKYPRELIRAVTDALNQGIDIPAEYADRVAQYISDHPSLGKREDIKQLVDKLKTAERMTTAGDDPTPEEQEEAGQAGVKIDRRQAAARDAKRQRRNNPPGAGEDRYGD